MQLYTIENEFLRIAVHSKGAELQELFVKKIGKNVLWNGNPKYWSKFSPILFPIVGTLKNNQYVFNGKQYQLTRHGFARDHIFNIAPLNDRTIQCVLTHNETTLKTFPFSFKLIITYTLSKEGISVNYLVQNTSDIETMYFSLGAHPAFAIPLFEGERYGDYKLIFDKEEQLKRFHLDESGLLTNATSNILLNQHSLPLDHALFVQDAIVLKNLNSRSITLANSKDYQMKFSWYNLPHFGIWAAPNAPFVCLEPWQGYADIDTHNQELKEKEGKITLSTGQDWQANWAVEF